MSTSPHNYLDNRHEDGGKADSRKESTVGTMMAFGPDGRGSILFSTAFRPTLGLTQPPIRMESGSSFPGVKRPRCEGNHSSPPSALVKKGGAIPYIFTAWSLV
jgi:hypothetical protein